MQTIRTPHGINVSYEKHGGGPPLVLVHGAFSDHRTNWEFVLPALSERFTVYSIARRGRGLTDATEHHSVEDEIQDAAAVVRTIGEPVFLLGHSYGAHVSLGVACLCPDAVRKVVLYEPAWPSLLNAGLMRALTTMAEARDWDNFSFHFFHKGLFVPAEELRALQASDLWPPILADAKASLEDLRAMATYDFVPGRFAALRMPVMLQIGTESPRHLYATDVLAALLPDVRVSALEGQAHEGMTTAPDMYAADVIRFLEQ